MKGYVTVLCLPLLLGAAGATSATTAILVFNNSKETTANTQRGNQK